MKNLAITIIAMLFTFLVKAQTKQQNYIKTTAYQVATTDTLVTDDEKI